MFDVNDETIIVGTTELRDNMPKISKEMKSKKVIIFKHNKPFAVLKSYAEYEEQEKLLDEFEDIVLGHIAKERSDSSSESDYVDFDTILKKHV